MTHNAPYYDGIVVLKQELDTEENVAYGATEILWININ